MDSHAENPAPASRETIHAMAAAVGLSLSDDRLDGLVTQAGPYLDMIRSLDGIAAATEPAAIFRLDEREAGR